MEKKEDSQVPKEHNKEGKIEEDTEVIDENLMDGLADEMEQKLNLTAGERDKDEELDPEMDKMFEKFMTGLQQDPEGATAFKEMNDMMKNMFAGQGLPEGMDQNPVGEEAEGEKYDKMTDMLLYQFMDKDILYEPLQSAQTELKASLEKENIDPKDQEQMQAQLRIIGELIEAFDKDPNNKEKMIGLFEQMNKVGSFVDILKKYSPQYNSKEAGGMEDFANLFGGAGGMGMGKQGPPGGLGGPGGKDEDCRLI